MNPFSDLLDPVAPVPEASKDCPIKVNPFAALLKPAPPLVPKAGTEFAYLSPDIIYDVIHSNQDASESKLTELEGYWSDPVRPAKHSVNIDHIGKLKHAVPEQLYGSIQLDFRQNEWFLTDVGKLNLHRMRLRFSSVALLFHQKSDPKEVKAIMTDFILKQLSSRYLEDFAILSPHMMDINDAIVNFCLSPNCLRLQWMCPVAPTIVTEIFQQLVSRNFSPNLIERKFIFYIGQEEIPVLAEDLEMKSNSSTVTHFTREFNKINPEMAVEVYITKGRMGTGHVYVFLRKRDDQKMLWALQWGITQLDKQMTLTNGEEREETKLQNFEATLEQCLSDNPRMPPRHAGYRTPALGQK
uniref:CRAL-TRIO domain-containing protein n=1 Tax=Steinernema glaseri TaxID=37863 RepID=A0A1I7YN47_9BILA